MVTAALLSACTHHAIPSQNGINGANPSVIGQPSNLRVEALDSFVPASAAEYAAGARFTGTVYALQNGITNTCIIRHGFRGLHGRDLTASAFAAQDVDNSQFPDLARIARTRSFDTGNGFKEPAALPQPEREIRRQCQKAATGPFLDLLRAGSHLEDEWFVVVNDIQASPPVRAKLTGFASCVEQEGVPPSSAKSLGGFLAWETGVDTHARTLAEIRTIDRHWAPIFARCAGPTVRLQENLQLVKKAVFLHRESRQVRQFQALVEPTVSKAEGR